MRTLRAVAPFLLLALGLTAIVAVAGATPASALPAPIVVDEWADEVNADDDCTRREAVATLDAGAKVDGRIVPTDPIIDLPSGTLTERGGVGPRRAEAESKMRRVLSALDATFAMDTSMTVRAVAPPRRASTAGVFVGTASTPSVSAVTSSCVSSP